jgi:AraC-like DNA-binding protein
MRPALSADLLGASPLGRYFVGDRFLAWCWDATLAGTAFWGRPTLADVQLALQLWRMDARLERYDSLVDLSHVEAIDAAPLEAIIEHLQSRLGWYADRVRRGAVIPPRAGVFPGVVIAGLWTVAAPLHPWAQHADTAAALAWFERGDGAAVGREVDRLIGRAIETSPALADLRRYLAAHLATATLVGAARVLRLSERTLQRTLRSARTSFSRELDRARVDEARRLLADRDRKVEEVALVVGCASTSHLARVFRRVTGQPPGAFREG